MGKGLVPLFIRSMHHAGVRIKLLMPAAMILASVGDDTDVT
jgi:hypothetical protein